jgi:hypothetical protein
VSTNLDVFLTSAEHGALDHTAVTGVKTSQVGFGGDMIAGNTFYGPATLVPGPLAGPPPNPNISHPVAQAGAIKQVAWIVGVPGGTFQLYINGLAAGTPFVAAVPIGTLPLTPAPVVPGNTVELEYVSGPAPTVSSFVFFIQG